MLQITLTLPTVHPSILPPQINGLCSARAPIDHVQPRATPPTPINAPSTPPPSPRDRRACLIENEHRLLMIRISQSAAPTSSPIPHSPSSTLPPSPPYPPTLPGNTMEGITSTFLHLSPRADNRCHEMEEKEEAGAGRKKEKADEYARCQGMARTGVAAYE